MGNDCTHENTSFDEDDYLEACDDCSFIVWQLFD